MKRTIILIGIALILLGTLAYLVFLIRDQKISYLNRAFETKKMSQPNQFNRTGVGQSNIPTANSILQGITLEITEPKAEAVYNNSSIKVSGKTSANAEVYINDIETKANTFGNFSINYNLDEGENLLTIVANDSSGNYAEKEIIVYLQTNE